jgi:hypothetical protein
MRLQFLRLPNVMTQQHRFARWTSRLAARETWAAVAIAFVVACGSSEVPEITGPAENAKAWANVLHVAGNSSGKTIKLTGWCRLEFEGTALYATQEAYDTRDVRNALWLQVGWPPPPELSAADGQLVTVTGVVRAYQGRFAFPAALEIQAVRTREGQLLAEFVKR